MCNNNKIIHWNLLRVEKKSSLGGKYPPPPISHVNLVRDDLIITPHISKHLYPYKYNAKDCIRTNACIY